MNIGIQYCGGCNNTYQRSLEVKKIREAFPTCNYSIGPQKKCDLMLYVCGCSRACISLPSNDFETIALTSEEDFQRLHQYLRQKNSTSPDPSTQNQKRCLTVGDTASIQKHITYKDGQLFAELTGDKNPIHLDHQYAENSYFEKTVIHGVFVTSLMSTVMGMHLPGYGTILMNENITHKHPAYYGDTITAAITLTGYENHRDFYLAHLHGICTNQNNVTLAEAYYTQLLQHKLFEIK